jgi:hypothetical protein
LPRKAVDKALDGDVIAVRFCLERLAPARKDSPITLERPAVRTAADAVETSARWWRPLQLTRSLRTKLAG